MRLRHALLLLACCVLALGVQLVVTWPERVDAVLSEQYGRGLRAVYTLELGLTAEVMRAQSGLLGHYDGLVEIEQRLKSKLATLRDPPPFLHATARAELIQAVEAAEVARRETEQRVEQFKSAHAVLRNSLRFLPIASRALDEYAAVTPEEQAFRSGALALVRQVLLLQAVNDIAQVERVGARLAALSLPIDNHREQLSLVLLHARIAKDRTPQIADLVQRIMHRPDVGLAERNIARYDQFAAAARSTEERNARVSFTLALLTVLAAALAVILRLRESAAAVRATAAELEQAVASLRVEQQKQLELAELKNRFVAMTSHEFRTPLSTIMSSSELIEAYADRWSKEKKDEHFGRIRGAVRSMVRLLDGVLMIGRSDADKLDFKPVPIALRRFCEEAIQSAAQSCREDHEITLQCADAGDVVVADEDLLRHVVDNLLSNAIKYSPRGSRVTLCVQRDGEHVQLDVSDQGIGIPAADQERLFETFERGSNVGATSGSGLGLAIAKRAIDLHGGTLGVTSHPGAGTRFTVRLPSERPAAQGARRTLAGKGAAV